MAILTDPLSIPDMGYSETPLVIGNRTATSRSGHCLHRTLVSTPDRFLFALLESGDLLDLNDYRTPRVEPTHRRVADCAGS